MLHQWLKGTGMRHLLWPPTPGGWFAPFYLGWLPMPLRFGWVHPRFRCAVPGCWRSWHHDQRCALHHDVV